MQGTRHLIRSNWLWRLPKQHRLLTLLLAWSPQLDGNSLLLKAQHTVVAGHGEINLELTCKLPPYWTAFTVPGVMQITRGEKSFMDLPSGRPRMLQY